jgi:nucleotide-binding universal stress UspA family protein
MKPFVFDHILAPTDLSDSSLPALRYARMLADRFSAKLTVLYVDPVVYPVDYLGPAGPYLNTSSEHETALRKDVEAYVVPTLEGRPYDIIVAIGQPIPSILAEAQDRKADLIVMGTHLRHGWRRALLGSVSEGVLHGAECPVLTVARDDAGGTMPYAVTNILCPINFSDVARDSLQYAAGLAEAFRARLTIVHVLESDEVANLASDEERVRLWVAPEVRARCSYRELVVRGGPAERVLDCAEDLEADLLVVGAQHKLFRDATVIGTTTERLIRFASCPVLIVPRGAQRRNRESQRKVEEGVLA